MNDLKILILIIGLLFSTLFSTLSALKMYDKIKYTKNLCLEKKINEKYCERIFNDY